MTDAVSVPVTVKFRAGWDSEHINAEEIAVLAENCLLYTSPSPRDRTRYRMPSSA